MSVWTRHWMMDKIHPRWVYLVLWINIMNVPICEAVFRVFLDYTDYCSWGLLSTLPRLTIVDKAGGDSMGNTKFLGTSLCTKWFLDSDCQQHLFSIAQDTSLFYNGLVHTFKDRQPFYHVSTGSLHAAPAILRFRIRSAIHSYPI